MHFIIFTSLLFGIFASSPVLTLLVMQYPVTGFPGGARGKEPDCPCGRHGDHGLSPRVGRTPLRRAWQPTPVFSPGESQGRKSLAGYSPWGLKVSDTTEET